ncbi:MAG: response regulator transcription factor [Treponema sp.]|jgi:DNA-binding NarL/FixJ family response regulator|nr:response regulator transcription factor [Treponema sp.]
MINIVIISSQNSEMDDLKKIIDAQPDISVVGQGRDEYEALKIVSRLNPDIALLDETLHIIGCAEIIPSIKRRSPKTQIIILTSFQENFRVLKAIRCGASGYLLKNTGQERFIAGIKTVYNGNCLMATEIAAKAFKTDHGIKPDAQMSSFFSSPVKRKKSSQLYIDFSRQELQVITCIAKGLSGKEIGEYLNLKEGTVRNYVTAILEKTHLKNRTQIAIYAHDAGLISVDQDRILPG